MTVQRPDNIHYKWRQYQIVGVNGAGLFDLEWTGVRPMCASSACWRGYVCTYAVKRNKLVLIELEIGLDEDRVKRQGITIFGIMPKRDKPPLEGMYTDPNTGEEVRGNWEFLRCHPLKVDIPYSGGMLLGRGFIEALRTRTTFHPAWKYKTVRELIFEQGLLVTARNRSREAKCIRERPDGMRSPPQEDASNEEKVAWAVFSLYQRPYGYPYLSQNEKNTTHD
jgi:hypothetical protein